MEAEVEEVLALHIEGCVAQAKSHACTYQQEHYMMFLTLNHDNKGV